MPWIFPLSMSMSWHACRSKKHAHMCYCQESNKIILSSRLHATTENNMCLVVRDGRLSRDRKSLIRERQREQYQRTNWVKEEVFLSAPWTETTWQTPCKTIYTTSFTTQIVTLHIEFLRLSITTSCKTRWKLYLAFEHTPGADTTWQSYSSHLTSCYTKKMTCGLRAVHLPSGSWWYFVQWCSLSCFLSGSEGLSLNPTAPQLTLIEPWVRKWGKPAEEYSKYQHQHQQQLRFIFIPPFWQGDLSMTLIDKTW